MYTTEFWIKSEEVQSIAFQEYWNNELIEKSKEWYIVDGNFNVMEQYLVKSGLLGSLAESKKYINDILHTDISGVCVDVAAGNMWAVKHLLEFGKISKVYAVEYSKHRLLKLGPLVLEHYISTQIMLSSHMVPFTTLSFQTTVWTLFLLPNHSIMLTTQ